jgi:hypothetical protein
MKKFNEKEFNELCAKFLGGIYSEYAKAWGFGNARVEEKEMNVQGKIYKNLVWAERFETKLLFSSDWNWLHEVVEKIESLKEGEEVEHNWYVTIGEGNYCRIFTAEFKTFQDEIIVENANTKKEAVIQAIWEFLNYFYQKK